MKIRIMAALIILGMLLVSIFACRGGGGSEATPTPTATPTPGATPTPTATPTKCEADRDAVQTAIYAYEEENGEWPTETGGPGDIAWEKLVPDYLPSIPTTDDDCDWSVNSDPEGEVCVGERVGCIPCRCGCGTGCAE
jgi:hypothetical protein